MALTTSTRSFVGKGQAYIATRASSGGPSDAAIGIGNASAITLTANENKIELLDYTTSGGGVKDSRSRIESVVGTITVHDISPENLAKAFRGSSTAITSAAVTDEAHTAYQGGKIFFNFIPDGTAAVVTGTGGTPTYVLDTDYTEDATGITILSTGSISDSTALEIDYTKNAAYVVEALVNSGTEFVLHVDGLNEVDSDNPVVVKMHRVKFNPAQNLGLISDEFGALEMTFDVLSDSTITTAGLSKYFKVQMVG